MTDPQFTQKRMPHEFWYSCTTSSQNRLTILQAEAPQLGSPLSFRPASLTPAGTQAGPHRTCTGSTTARPGPSSPRVLCQTPLRDAWPSFLLCAAARWQASTKRKRLCACATGPDRSQAQAAGSEAGTAACRPPRSHLTVVTAARPHPPGCPGRRAWRGGEGRAAPQTARAGPSPLTPRRRGKAEAGAKKRPPSPPSRATSRAPWLDSVLRRFLSLLPGAEAPSAQQERERRRFFSLADLLPGMAPPGPATPRSGHIRAPRARRASGRAAIGRLAARHRPFRRGAVRGRGRTGGGRCLNWSCRNWLGLPHEGRTFCQRGTRFSSPPNVYPDKRTCKKCLNLKIVIKKGLFLKQRPTTMSRNNRTIKMHLFFWFPS